MNKFALFQWLLPVLCLAVTGSGLAQPGDADTRAAGTTLPASALHHGAIGVGSWNTAVEFKDIVVTSNGVVLYRSDFRKQGTNGWRVSNGVWSAKDGVLRQSAGALDCRATTGNIGWADYTLTLRARKTGGEEGFLVLVNWLDDNNWTWFNIGGWSNSLSAIEQALNGTKIFLGGQVPQTIETNVWYDIRVVLSGKQIECYVNSDLIIAASYSELPAMASSQAAPSVNPAEPIESAGPIESVKQVLSMSGTNASKGMAVHAEGWVVNVDPVKSEALFKDATGAIWVPVDLNKNPIQPGARVVLDGKTGAELVRYPDHPSGSHYLASFEAPQNVDDLYFARVRGFLYPPRTGEYTFWIASDNGGELWLSTDDDPKHIRKIAAIPTYAYTPFHGWDQTPGQKSVKITLEADKRYYIEALHVEIVGEDCLSVAWEGPGISRTVIDGSFLSPPDTTASAPGSNRCKQGSILREYWLNYFFVIDAGQSVEAYVKNPFTRYGKSRITDVSLTPVKRDAPPPAESVTIEQPWPEQSDFQWVEVEGAVSQISDLDNYWTVLELTDQGRQMKARLANPGHEKIESWLNARVKVRGFCEGALTANGGRVASVVWVPDVRDIAVIPPAGDDWERLPRISVRDLNSASSAARVGRRIRMGGECLEVRQGELLVRDSESFLSAHVSTNGLDWMQVGGVIEIPMKHSVYAGIATYAASNSCIATYDHVSASLFPGSKMEIGSPKAAGSALGDATNLVTTGTGVIGGRAGFDVLKNDECSFFYRRLDGDGEMVARMASIALSDTNNTGDTGGGSGLMIRESLEGNSRMFYLVCSTLTGMDLRVRRGAGNPIEGFPNGSVLPCWLKVVRQSARPVRTFCSQMPELAPNQPIEVMGVLGYTNQEWVLSEAFCRIPPALAGTNAPRQSLTEIATVRQIRQLGADELKLGRPAKIEGVITVEADDIYVQDDTGGIRIPSIAAQKLGGFEVGQRLRIAGRSVPGGLSPILEPGQQADSVRLLGRGRMPRPIKCTWSQLMLGRQDCQWVKVRGVIRRIEGRALKLQMPGGDIAASLDFDLPEDKRGSLIDSTVSVEGVCRMTVNEKKQLMGVQLIVPKAEFIVVDEASPADPFAVAPQPINRLLQFGEQAELVHRVKIEGAVTYCHNGVFYIQDATGGIEVTGGARTFEPGDRVEVLGFPESNGSTVNLADALIRKAGSGALPEPVKLGGDLPQAAHASRLVAMNAIFLGHSTLLDSDVLQLRNGNRIFQGMLPKQRGALPNLELGSLLRLTGVCRLVKNATAEPSKSDPDFDLLLCAPSNVVLLEAPPWWNWRRLLWVGGTFIGVVTVAGAWIAMILRKNRLLKLAHQELRKAADELEIRVEHRTADLAKSNAGLSHEQALLRTLLDNASDFIFFKDANSRFVRCSLSLCARAGLAHEQMVGKTDFDLSLEEFARSAFEDEREIIRTGQPLVGKLEREVHADGKVTWVLTTKMPWRSPDGKIIGTFGISRDITSIKEAEAELERAQKQLQEASHAAGMAEVATGVLHNVGNVLNSVNISTTLLIGQVKKFKVELVGRVAAMMKEHAADLGLFVTQDPQGQRLPEFLSQLADQLKRERTTALEELTGLEKNVDHIKEIVAMQQSYATVSGVSTTVKIAELLEDALRLTESSLNRHGIKFVKEFDPHLPEVTLDHHKALQIMINLIRNAKDACDDAQRVDKRITLRATAGEGKVKISVTDNGVGIPVENLTRIFAHGFTTRKNGHGFGLHNSALAAKQIGGNLLVHSDGPGKGATFTLELGLNPKAGGQLHRIPDRQPDAAATVEA